MQLRSRKNSKSSIEKAELIRASNEIRDIAVVDLFRGSLNAEIDLELIRRHIKFLAQPPTIMTFFDGKLGLDSLDKVYSRFVEISELQYPWAGAEERKSILAVLSENKLRKAREVVKSIVLKFGESSCRDLQNHVGLTQGDIFRELINSCI